MLSLAPIPQKSIELQNRIVLWNINRGCLDSFDPQLEVSMLSEEAREFMLAPTLAERLQEYADMVFVWVGTQAKFYSRKVKGFNSLYQHEWEAICDWYKGALNFAEGLLIREMEELGLPHLELIENALLYVIEANEAKGKEKGPDGKVVKGPNYVSPLKRIKEDLEEYESK